MPPLMEKDGAPVAQAELSTDAPERLIFGEHNFMAIPYPWIIILNQVRGKANPEAGRIKESILTHGLINNIDVARMTPEQFEGYFKAVRHIYRNDPAKKAETFRPGDDGMYYLAYAGHTRYTAIGEIIDDKIREAAANGSEFSADQVDIICKVDDNLTTEEILARQMAENLHSTPPPERSAMAIVEYYIYGVMEGLWSSKAEFRRATEDKVTEETLSAALAFVELPNDIREFVFAGTFAYGSAVALGGLVPTREAYLSKKYYDKEPEGLDEEEARDLSETLQEWLAVEVLHIQNHKFSVEKTKKYVKTLKGEMEKELADEQADLTINFFIDPTEAMIEERRTTHRRYRALLDERMGKKAQLADRALAMHLTLFGDTEAAARMTEQFESYLDHLRRPLGRPAAKQTLRVA